MPGYTLDDRPDGVVKNKLGATTHDELKKREADFVARARLEIELGHGPRGRFDAEHLKAFHRHLFQRVFEWAGYTRDEHVHLSDGSVAIEPILRKVGGKDFLDGPAIPAALDRIARIIRDADCLRGLSREQFAVQAADLMADLNGVHPFREGNGRTQRTFMRELAKQAGHSLDFTVVSQERMAQASITAHEAGDISMMHRMFDEISHPPRAEALREAIDSLEQHGFPWNDHYLATAEPGRPVEVIMAGVAGKHFMARTSSQILIGKTSDLPEPHPEGGQRFTFAASERCWE